MPTKSIAKRTMPLVSSGFIVDKDLPVIPFSNHVEDAQCSCAHSHPRAQLIYSTRGTMQVKVKDKMWLVSSRQAIWVPPMFEHQVYYLNENDIRNLFIDPAFTHNLPSTCFALDVSPFLRELVLKTVSIGTTYRTEGPEYRIVQVLLDELASIRPTKCFLPMSEQPVIQKITETLLQDPGNKNGLNEFADITFTTTRTLSRLFSKELGISFGEWRKQLRLMESIIALERGSSIAEIAYELGYNSPSAFIEMFRKYYGVSPGKFLQSA